MLISAPPVFLRNKLMELLVTPVPDGQGVEIVYVTSQLPLPLCNHRPPSGHSMNKTRCPANKTEGWGLGGGGMSP